MRGQVFEIAEDREVVYSKNRQLKSYCALCSCGDAKGAQFGILFVSESPSFRDMKSEAASLKADAPVKVVGSNRDDELREIIFFPPFHDNF